MGPLGRGQAREQRLRGQPRRRSDHVVGQRLAAQVRHGQPRARGPQVDAADAGVAGVELHEGGPAAAARGARAEVPHHPAADEVSHQAAHRGRGQAGGVHQLGPGERAGLVNDHGQKPLQVEPPELGRVARAGVGALVEGHGPRVVSRRL